MKRPEWEKDLRNRQRNIVFPDTVLNQGTFYRNLLSRNAHLNSVQRFGAVILSLSAIAGSISLLVSMLGLQDDTSGVPWISRITVIFMAVLSLLIGVRLMKQAVRVQPEFDRPKRRNDYQHPTKF